jgi:DNA-binding YbaB/EbfC family protein
MGFGGNMQKMMKQVQKMQADMARLQEELATRNVEAGAGGGMVTVVVNGKQEVMSIKIKPEAVDPEDVEMLEDLLVAAVKEAMRKSQEMASEEMNKITGGMKIPGLF